MSDAALLIALLSGFALIRMGDLGARVLKGIDAVSVIAKAAHSAKIHGGGTQPSGAAA